MAEANETRLTNLENRLGKVEEYINRNEKEQLLKTLEEIRGNIRSINDRQIRTQWQWPFNLGVTLGFSAMALGFTFLIVTSQVELGLEPKHGAFAFLMGLLIVLLSFLSFLLRVTRGK